MINKVKDVTGVTDEETFDDAFSQIHHIGFFTIGHAVSQKVITSRAEELGWEVKHTNWLEAHHNF
jgi:methylmalonyl-CoA mutase cobalamin-binding subunit